MRISDWSSDVCSSDLGGDIEFSAAFDINSTKVGKDLAEAIHAAPNNTQRFAEVPPLSVKVHRGMTHDGLGKYLSQVITKAPGPTDDIVGILKATRTDVVVRSEEHTSELQSLMRISYAVFCLKKKNKNKRIHKINN